MSDVLSKKAITESHQRQASGLFRSLWLWVGILLVTFFYGSISLIPSIFHRPDGVHRWAIRWGRALARFSGTNIYVRHLERLHQSGTIILLSNHQSLFDIPTLYAFLDIPFRWMAKASLFKIPIVGWAMKGADYISVERGDSKQALKSLFDAADQIHSGKSVIIFPEGTRAGATGQMGPFKKGGFLLAKKASVTIQPVALWGNHHVVPRIKGTWVQRICPGDVFVEVLDPIQPEQFANMKAEELSKHLYDIMEAAVERLKAWEAKTIAGDVDFSAERRP